MLAVANHTIIDYAVYLRKLELRFAESGPYYLWGEDFGNGKWELHVSLIQIHMERFLDTLLPIIASWGYKMRIPRNEQFLGYHNAGFYGYEQIGKGVTVFLGDPERAVRHVQELLPALKGLRGPRVPDSFSIGENLYISFLDKTVKKENNAKDGSQIRIPDNPFMKLIKEDPAGSQKRTFNGKYYPRRLISSSIKGNLIEGYFFKGLARKECVIKQGRANIIDDRQGRDMRDRLKWQFELYKRLGDGVPMPKMYAYFEENDDGFLVMDYLPGKSLFYEVVGIHRNQPWFDLALEHQAHLMDLLLQIVKGVAYFHANGFVHRDVAPSNFIISPEGKAAFIDVELAYSLNDHFPSPAFTWGTPGVAAPEQIALQQPERSADIYSLGALMTFIFTGQEPGYLIEPGSQRNHEVIELLTRNRDIADLIMECIAVEPEKRPGVDVVLERVGNIAKSMKSQNSPVQRDTQHEEVSDILKKGIHALASHYLAKGNLWLSEYKGIGTMQLSAEANTGTFPGLAKGVTGVLYLLAQLKSCGLDIGETQPMVDASLKFLVWDIQRSLSTLPPGLHFGSCGIAMALCTALKHKLVEPSREIIDFIRKCLFVGPKDLCMIFGEAGRGMALLQWVQYTNDPELLVVLSQLAEKLVVSQEADGSWVLQDYSKGVQEKLLDFGYGAAGITYFLLEYHKKFGGDDIMKTCTKGLQYITSRLSTERKNYTRIPDIQSVYQSPWWCNGTSGMALLYLSAFEYLKAPELKTAAVELLQQTPLHFTSQSLGQCHGLSGLGEVYLQAEKILAGGEWKERSGWIIDYLMAIRKEPSQNIAFWLTENNVFPTADLMFGTSGILHFLLRYCYPEQVGFPLLKN
ncbi:lanthionine synthetase LanC family protein [Chitinophaga sp. YIM B06452]|uniref:lanthionine synthetase LanC family protein n=1 Tax=Chitinophaga sp. YIM B06452 TaxID=3082158 RepID=UPI0031FE5FE5